MSRSDIGGPQSFFLAFVTSADASLFSHRLKVSMLPLDTRLSVRHSGKLLFSGDSHAYYLWLFIGPLVVAPSPFDPQVISWGLGSSKTTSIAHCDES
ncbi:hypothetical protein V6N13_100913 [Hibiscus sabdariffa]|uniref:Uncharacterized protein n=1 Tax=Hibiscus sabdariffa TaxID=183260 RepID=A0ABR2QK99_9ROSI